MQADELPEGYCERCGEPHECALCHDSRRVRLTAPRDDEAYADVVERDPNFGRTVLCSCVNSVPEPEEKRLARMQIPSRLLGKTLANWQPNNAPARIAAQNFACQKPWPGERFQLLLSGPPGRGKTHLAVGVMRTVLSLHNVGGMFAVVPEVMDRLKATYDEDTRTETTEAVLGQLTEVALLTLDDLGAERSTPWAQEQLFKIVDGRYRAGRPTIITTNLETAAIDERVLSRIGDREVTEFVELDGARYRDHRIGEEPKP